MTSTQKTARIAGALYLVIFIVYPLAAFIGKASIVVPGDAAATVKKYYGFHLLLLGYLVYKSDLFPSILGILLVFGGLGYLLQSFGVILVPQYDELLETVVLISGRSQRTGFYPISIDKGRKKPRSCG